MSKLNIVIPMAGTGSRFANIGYKTLKPFIEINGKMMIESVLDGIKYDNANYIIIIRRAILEEYGKEINYIKNKYNIKFVIIEKPTMGASCTALAAHNFINNPNSVLFCDCDNIIDNGIFHNFIDFCQTSNADGSLLTFHSDQNCFSFVKINSDNYATDIKEKEVISNNAIAGFYFFKQGSDFVNSAINIMIYNEKSKNEFYISNTFNDMIRLKKKINIYNIDEKYFYCVGTPEQVEQYLQLTSTLNK